MTYFRAAFLTFGLAIGGLGVLSACGGSDSSGLIGGGAAGMAGSSGSGGSGGSSASGGVGGSGGSPDGGGAAGMAGTGGTGGGGTCSSSGDCAAPTPVCEPISGACVGCLFSSDCSPGDECRKQACVTPKPCNNSLDCVGSPLGGICDTVKGCVECVLATDCSGTADCVNNTCAPYTGCQNSLDCPQGQVCSAAKRCVECVGEADCSSGEQCISNKCEMVTKCTSDNQCTPLGKLCDKTEGVCVACLKHSDCPDVAYCNAGSCALDVCPQGSSECSGNSIRKCSASGDSWLNSAPCGASTTCVQQGGSAGCEPWVCNAGSTYCDGEKIVECAANGLSVVSSTDCAQQGKHCVNASCQDQVCQPNQDFCQGTQLRHCNAAGTNSALVQNCTGNTYCNASASACSPRVCSPGAASCNGDVATTCNSNGSGYLPGGTDCAAMGQFCNGGACTSCPAGTAPPTSVRMKEVFIGDYDYIVLENQGACTVNLSGLYLVVKSSTASDLTFPLPSRALAPGASVYVVDSGAEQTGDIVSMTNIYFTSSSGEIAMLCTGPTCTASNVVDGFAHASGAQPPPFPTGISFVGAPLSGITTSDENSSAYLRDAFAGQKPAFLASDWKKGSASRTGANACPATQPVNSTSCTAFGVSCTYGAVTCSCLFSWSCS